MLLPSTPPILHDEDARLRELRAIGILDTEPEAAFDDIVRVAAELCDTPMATITFIDADRQWFKSSVGLESKQTTRNTAFCAHTIGHAQPLVVCDSLDDRRFAANPYVTGAPGIRFYAGVPVRSRGGYAVGTVAVMDRRPRTLDDRQLAGLALLGRHVSLLLASRAHAADVATLLARLTAAQEVARIGGFTIVVSTGRIECAAEVLRMLGGTQSCGTLTFDDGVQRVHADDRDRLLTAYAAAIVGHAPLDIELRVLHADGSLRHVRLTARLVNRLGDHGPELRGSAQDLTELRTVEQQLRMREAQYQLMFDAHPEPVWAYDAETFHFLSVNDTAVQKYGWSRDDFLGMTLLDVQVPINASLASQAPSRGATPATEHGRDARHRRRDGSIMEVEIASSPIMMNGRPAQLAVVRDVTAQREATRRQQEILRAQRLDSLGTLAGGIAHDLNNVLTPILMSIEFLRMPLTHAEREETLDTLTACAERGADMVRQVLSFARGVDGRRSRVIPEQLVADVKRLATDTFPREITVETRLRSGVPAVLGDPTQLHQVLVNLCVNARDAMPSGGQLTIGLDLASSQASSDDGSAMVAFTVEDTGTGMTQDVMDRIFEPFFTTKDTGAGTGLGLSTSLAIVRSHGGELHVESVPGAGSRFTVSLPPMTAAVEPPPASAHGVAPRGKGETILVIDDEPSVRQLTRQTLEACNYRVLLASDGVDALSQFRGSPVPVSCVVTDMMMPAMDGVATISALRCIDPGLRVIAVSGLAVNATITRLTEVGVRHILAKPYTAGALLTMLRDVLEEPA